MNGARQSFVHAGGPTEEALFDYLAGRLHPQAGEWIAAHVAACARCTAAVERVEAVHEALEPPPASPFQLKRDLQEVRRRLERPRRRVRRVLWPAFGTLAACALLLLFVPRVPRSPDAPGHAVAKAAPVAWTVLAQSGSSELEANGQRRAVQVREVVAPGGVVAVPPAARVVAEWGGARVMIDGGASGARVRLQASSTLDRTLHLERGRVILNVDPLAPGARLAVETATERVTVHGTIFLVDAEEAGTSVAVERGKVEVELLASRVSASVPAGMRLDPLPARVRPLDASDRQAFVLLAQPEAATLAPAAAVTPTTAATSKPATRSAPAATIASRSATQVEKPAPSVPAPAAHENIRSADAAVDAARADVLAGRYPRAIARLEALRRNDLPATLGARSALLLAQALRLDRHADRAAPLLEKVARGGGPEAEQAQYLLAQTLERDLADPRRAAEAWAESARRFPRGIFREESTFRLGQSLLEAGETQAGVDALEAYLKSFGAAAHADDAHLLIAAARRDRLNDCAGALPHLSAVAAGHGPRAEGALIGAARCDEKLGRSSDARAAYQRYLATWPTGRFAGEARAHLDARASRR